MTPVWAFLAFLFAAPPALAADPPSGAAEKVFTLEEAQRLALLNDAHVLSAEQDKIIAAERVRESRYLFLPELGVQASATKFEARYPFALSGDSRNILLFPDAPNVYGVPKDRLFSGRGYMHMSLYEGRRTINTLRLAQAGRKQAESNHDSARMDTVLKVKEVFFRLLLAQDRLAAAESLQQDVEDAARSGALSGWERLEGEARLSAARGRASQVRHELTLAKLAFLKTLNLELDTPFRLAGKLEPKPVTMDIAKAVLWAMELRPELQSQTYKAQMDAISVNLAYARRIPTVFLAGDYEVTNHSFPLRQNNWDVTVGVKLPFSYDYFTQLRQKRAEQRQGQLRRAELQDSVRLEVRQAYETLQYWQKEWPARESELKRVEGMLGQSSRQASIARTRALEAVVELRLAERQAAVEMILAKAKLERAVGREITAQ